MDSPKTFQEFVAQCHEEDPDFGKVDNSNPSIQFAFELEGNLEVFRVAGMSLDEAEIQLRSFDDFGKRVSLVPLNETSFEGSFEFDDYGFDFSEYGGDSMSAAEFVWRLSRHIAGEVYCNPNDYALTFDPEDLKDLVFYRFFYSESDDYWSIILESKSEQIASPNEEGRPAAS